MSPNINQNVFRRRPSRAAISRLPSFQTQNKFFNHLRWQRGSISSATITVAISLVVILSISFLSFFYLGQVLSSASQESNIQQLETRLIELKEQQREIELEGANLRSIESIEQRVNSLNLIYSNQVTYLHQHPDKVASLSL